LVNVVPNVVQAAAGIIVGLLLMGVFKKTNIEF
jgi:uncharacterized membrane protein